MIRATRTYALMEVSEGAYNEILKKLRDAGYDHAIHDDEGGALDMHGIALVKRAPPPATAHASTSPGPVNCNIRLHFQNKGYPRSCERCGPTGTCPFFNGDGTAKTTDV